MLNIAQLAAIAKGATTINMRQSIIQSPLQLLIYLKGLLMQNQIYLYSNVPVFLTFYPDFFQAVNCTMRLRPSLTGYIKYRSRCGGILSPKLKLSSSTALIPKPTSG